MAVWLVRAGSHGEYELKFIQENRVYVTWAGLDVDLSALKDRDSLASEMTDRYPEAKPNTIKNWVNQIWRFAHEIEPGDLVILPLKAQRAIQIGEISSGYHFEPEGPDPFFHWRAVNWVGEAIPRSHFSQDLLNSFGAFLTICRIERNDAEARIQAMRASGWKPEAVSAITAPKSSGEQDSDVGDQQASAGIDVEEAAGDQIVRLINARFKGHGLTILVDAILRAQGYTTYVSPEGADGGADILAGSGSLGFGNPRLCVEVKSEVNPIGRPAVDKLLGAVSKFGADEGLFISWSGFKGNVRKELAASFFRVRLWGPNELLEQLFDYYDELDEDIKAELPLKRIWTVAAQEE